MGKCCIENMASSNKLVRGKKDRISNLPDSILGAILSRLPTEAAVRTSVLSKRWAYLWTFINKLHIADMPYSIRTKKMNMRRKKKPAEKRCFVNFVSRVLLHLGSSSIESFYLELTDTHDPSYVNAWISAVLNRKVQILTIRYYHELTFLSSYSLFNCYSLVALELRMNCTIRVPLFAHLPNLKTLVLIEVTLKGDSSCTSKDLTLSFPVLKKFEVFSCTWSNVQNVILQVPLLEVVVIKLYSKPINSTLKFCASRLREFTYDGLPSQCFTLSHQSAAPNASANIRLSYLENDLETGLGACMLLKHFSQVKSLKLNLPRDFSSAKESFKSLPAFKMLRHLELDYVTGEILIGLLQKSPSLTTLKVKEVSKFDEELVNSTHVPNCVTSTLQAVKILWGDSEFHLAKFVIENALVLERFCISRPYPKSKMDEVERKLFSFKKASNLAIINFVDKCSF